MKPKISATRSFATLAVEIDRVLPEAEQDSGIGIRFGLSTATDRWL